MGWISHVIVLLYLVGTLAKPQRFYEPGLGVVQNEHLLDANTGEKFSNVFERSLRMCGAFTNEEAREYKQIILVLSDAFGSFPDFKRATPGVLKATAASFASAIAEKTAADIGTSELYEKTRCVIQALMKAFIVTTGMTNPFFILEVEKLIEVFYLTRGISYSPVTFGDGGEDIGGGVKGVETVPSDNFEAAAPKQSNLGEKPVAPGGGNTHGEYDTGSYPNGEYDSESTPSGEYDSESSSNFDYDSESSPSGEYDTGSYPTGEYDSESYPSGEYDSESSSNGEYDTGSYPTGEYD
ncbi:aggregate spidroin 1B variant 1, partial [Trichonephila inaurata madagascariensis]